MNNTDSSMRERSRGIYLLPNLFTTGAMFSGFYAIIASIDHRFTVAAIAVFVASLLDAMDGRVARMTHTQTDFGVQYDSLSDLISFGLAPAVILYVWSLQYLHLDSASLGKLGWAAAFIYAACAALRLARFNTQVGVADKRYFQGLASPAAAGVCMAFVWVMHKDGISGESLRFMTPVISIVVGLLMVSKVRYISFKAWPGNEKVTFLWAIAAVLILFLLAIDTARVLLIGLTIYVVSGPVMTGFGIIRHRRQRVSTGTK